MKILKILGFGLLAIPVFALGGGNILTAAIPALGNSIALIVIALGAVLLGGLAIYLGVGIKGDVVIGDNNNIYKPTTNLIEHHFHVDSPQQLGPRVDKETQKWLSGSSSRQS
ncbi:MAG: hypothetical protein QG593_367 [Patescibacteria group bacterium]|nr:hypothetical protein [Patescibacteria group bacterium]MDQ5969850.1 hypothetical protein [Patescibacteria group bacterium]